jgi:4'-phosphopantetheinyl transferase EntD
MIETLLPPAVRAVELFADPPGALLLPDEMACVAQAVEARRREFTTGRHCARLALVRLGLPPTAIGKGPGGAPCWPAGVIGSITHCAGYRAAAVARSEDLIAIGIDAEPDEPLPAGVLDLVSSPVERSRLAALAARAPGVAWDRVLFSAKESVYKTWFPLTGEWLGFDGADISLGLTPGVDATVGTFVARILAPGATVVGDERGELHGRFAVRHGLAVTAIAR